jgi:hypothetical protein
MNEKYIQTLGPKLEGRRHLRRPKRRREDNIKLDLREEGVKLRLKDEYRCKAGITD